MFVHASPTTVVSIFEIQPTEIKQWFLSTGSLNKAMQTHKEHPSRPGVSYAKLSQAKLVVVLGDILRVYSFDFA